MAQKLKPQKRKYSDGTTAWLVQVSVKGFKRTSRTFATKEEAVAWAEAHKRELKAQRERGGVRADVTTLTIKQLVEEFLADPEIKALRYFDDLELLLAWWVNHCGSDRVLRVNVLVLRQARDKLRTGRAPATVNRYLSAMRSAWNWARASGLIPQDLNWPGRLMLKEPKGRTRFLNDAELVRILEAAKGHSPTMSAAVVVSLATGVRQSELLRLEWADLDLTGKHSPSNTPRLLVRESKNDEMRAVHLPQAAVAALRVLKQSPVVGVRVFVDDAGEAIGKSSLEHRWREIRATAKLADFKWHDLRHSCASFLAQQGANLLEIGSVLGHKSTVMTKRYAHLIAGAPVTGHTKLDEKLGSR